MITTNEVRTSRVCDGLDCPATAVHRVEVFGQDFYFCTHHWAKLVRQQ